MNTSVREQCEKFIDIIHTTVFKSNPLIEPLVAIVKTTTEEEWRDIVREFFTLMKNRSVLGLLGRILSGVVVSFPEVVQKRGDLESFISMGESLDRLEAALNEPVPLPVQTGDINDELHPIPTIPDNLTEEQKQVVIAHFQKHDYMLGHLLEFCMKDLWDCMIVDLGSSKLNTLFKLIPTPWAMREKCIERPAYQLIALLEELSKVTCSFYPISSRVKVMLGLLHLHTLLVK